jgi:hypothetical protein
VTIFDRNRPRILSYEPAAALPGQEVTVTGINFTPATRLYLNGLELVTLMNPSHQLFARIPDEARSGAITVSNIYGSETSDSVLWVLPRIDGVLSRAATKHREAMTIHGAGLAGATSVTMDNVVIALPGHDAASPTSLMVTLPDGVRTGLVTVRTPAGAAVSPHVYRVPAEITSISPQSGTAGTAVAITGTDFRHVTAVAFNGVPAQFQQDAGGKSLRTTVPAGATSGRLRITIVDGQGAYEVISDQKFTVRRP